MILNEKVIERLMGLLAKQYPEKYPEQHKYAINGFIEYIMLAKTKPNFEVPMYSKSVDFVWHQFILDTREYFTFCQEHFGGYLHHIPNDVELGELRFNDTKNEELKALFLDLCKIRNISIYSTKVDDAPYYFLADQVLYDEYNISAELKHQIELDFLQKNKSPGKSLISNLFGKKQQKTNYESSYENYNSKTSSHSHSSDFTDLLLPVGVGLATGLLVESIIEDQERRNDYISDTIITSSPIYVDDTPVIQDSSSCSSSSCSSSSCSSSSSYSSCSSSSCSSSSCSSSSCSSSSCSSSSCASSF